MICPVTKIIRFFLMWLSELLAEEAADERQVTEDRHFVFHRLHVFRDQTTDCHGMAVVDEQDVSTDLLEKIGSPDAVFRQRQVSVCRRNQRRWTGSAAVVHEAFIPRCWA